MPRRQHASTPSPANLSELHDVKLYIDLETYSSEDIKSAGLYRYVQSPDHRILLMSYAIDDGEVQIIDFTRGETIPSHIYEALMDTNVEKHAYNAAFEWYCLSTHLKLPDPLVWLPQWRCTMVHALYCGYMAALSTTAEALGLPVDKQKDLKGNALIKLFCTPYKNGAPVSPKLEPEKWELFRAYNMQDVVAERAVEDLLTSQPVPDAEWELWRVDIAINLRGVRLDTSLIDAALDVYAQTAEELTQEATELSGLDNPASVRQLTEWLSDELQEEVSSLRKADVAELLESDLPDRARRMLEIRQALAKSSVAKYAAMRACIGTDGRARGLLMFYGASRTGRWAGRLVQAQNLPRNYLKTLDIARTFTIRRNINALHFLYGNVPDTLSQLIRTAFIPSASNTFIVADFSAIEARVIAWLAGERWVQDVFATHGKIYEACAAQMFGVDIATIAKGQPNYALRQRGKVATLALGYQGGVNSLIQMGALNYGVTQDELPDIVRRWRDTNRRIVDLWYAVENAALETVRTGAMSAVNPARNAYGVLFAIEGAESGSPRWLTIRLPSGRKLYYAEPTIGVNRFGSESIHYRDVSKNSRKFTDQETYGGRLVENIVQATARDCLAVAISRLEAAGYPIVMHIHDEVVIDSNARDPDAALADVREIMGLPIPWAPELQLRADGFTSDYYMKD